MFLEVIQTKTKKKQFFLTLPKTFGLNIFNFFNLLALYLEYIYIKYLRSADYAASRQPDCRWLLM